jgi:hypothetical protein
MRLAEMPKVQEITGRQFEELPSGIVESNKRTLSLDTVSFVWMIFLPALFYLYMIRIMFNDSPGFLI